MIKDKFSFFYVLFSPSFKASFCFAVKEALKGEM